MWESALAQLQLNLSSANFQTWFKGKTAINSWDENILEIGCNSPYVKNWLESRYQAQIKAIIEQVAGRTVDIAFTVNPMIKQEVVRRRTAPIDRYQHAPLFPNTEKDVLEEALTKARLNPNFSFDNFVVGKSNELAYAVARAIVGGGNSPNPFFVYGGAGVGKTHLIQAIAQEKLYQNNNLKTLYCTCEDFTNELVASIQAKTTVNFRKKFRGVDVLLIDDVQFLSGREATQEELFHTFNSLFATGKQIVLASDRPPVVLKRVDERLKGRFQSGMVADIGSPELELREAVVAHKSKAQNLSLSQAIIRTLAEAFPGSIRDVEGGLVRLFTYSRVTSRPISQALLSEVIDLTNRERLKKADPKLVLNEVAKHFLLSVQDLNGQSRKRNLVFPRQIAMYILRTDLKLSLVNIAEVLNKADHTSVIYSVNKILASLATSPKTCEIVGEIRSRVFT